MLKTEAWLLDVVSTMQVVAVPRLLYWTAWLMSLLGFWRPQQQDIYKDGKKEDGGREGNKKDEGREEKEEEGKGRCREEKGRKGREERRQQR